MNKTIYMYATLPKKGKIPFGGGEVGNVRTIRMFREAGYKVVTMRQRKAHAEWGRIRVLASYPFRILAGWLDVLFTMLFGSRKGIAHLSGFAGVTILNEYVIMHIMRLLGYDVVYELRGGGAINSWDNGSSSYKRMFRYLLNNACYVFVQGKENIPLIESICKTPVYHYANCVEDGFAPVVLPFKPTDKINLLFYGRCEENKHVDMIVEAAALVQKELPNAHLTVVGNGRASYINMVQCKLKELLKEDTYTYLLGCKHEELPSLLIDKHFYIFPSTQPREGQSNSVTECMSYGIIPIASPQGFNSSTVGDDYLIVEELTAKAYADRIVEIVKRDMVEHYSRQVFEHFQNNFTQKVVFEKTLAVYGKIINGIFAENF